MADAKLQAKEERHRQRHAELVEKLLEEERQRNLSTPDARHGLPPVGSGTPPWSAPKFEPGDYSSDQLKYMVDFYFPDILSFDMPGNQTSYMLKRAAASLGYKNQSPFTQNP